MSFYGTIYNQISNAFEHIHVRNSGKNNNDVFIDREETIRADGREGEICFDTGNRWITLEGDATENFCKIYHAEPDTLENSTGINIFTEITSIPVDQDFIDINLANDQFLEVKGLCFDDTGHISGVSSQYLKFNIVQAEADIAEMRADIDNFKDAVNTDINNFKVDVNNELDRFEERLIDQEEFVDRVEALENIEADKKINAINTFIGNHKLLTNQEATEGHDGVTLCGALGNIDYLRNNGKDSSNTVMLAESIDQLGENDSICDYINALKVTLEFMVLKNTDLERRIIALENK